MLSHSVSLVLAFVCLWYAQVSEGHRPDLENVAYSKKVTLSSQYKHASYPGSNAVNGLLSDFAHSDLERFPWIRIDLERRFLIHEIEVFVRTDCCGMWMFIIYNIYQIIIISYFDCHFIHHIISCYYDSWQAHLFLLPIARYYFITCKNDLGLALRQ